MSDALAALLNLPGNQTPGGPNVSTYTPNVRRNNVRSTVLAKFLGIPEQDATGGFSSQQDLEDTYAQVEAAKQQEEQEKAQLATLPERVKGEYGVQTENIKGQTARDIAQKNLEREIQVREAQREFTANQNQLNRDAVEHGRQETQAGENARAGMVSNRQQTSLNESRARLYEVQDAKGNFKMNAPRPANEGLLDRYIFGPSQADLNRAAATQLRSGGGASNPSDDELKAVILQHTPDATPEEIQQWISEMRGGR